MPHSITAKTISGIIAVSDEEVFNTGGIAPESISQRASDEGFFVIDTEDEAELRIEIWEDVDASPKAVDAYESIGGTFRLNVPSGSLRVWDPGDRADGEHVDIPSGTYALSVKRMNTRDLSNYLKESQGVSPRFLTFIVFSISARRLHAVFEHISQMEATLPTSPQAEPDKHPDPPQ